VSTAAFTRTQTRGPALKDGTVPCHTCGKEPGARTPDGKRQISAGVVDWLYLHLTNGKHNEQHTVHFDGSTPNLCNVTVSE